jgi:hypothetical protein
MHVHSVVIAMAPAYDECSCLLVCFDNSDPEADTAAEMLDDANDGTILYGPSDSILMIL